MLEKRIHIPKVFIVFLVVSFFIWLLINLSKEYSTTITYKTHYNKLPQNKILQKDPIKEIDLVVKGSGFKLLSTNFSNRKLELDIDHLIKKTKNDFYFLTNSQKSYIQKQLNSGLKLENIIQDTISFKLGRLKTKKVPLIPILNIKYRLGYNIAEKIKITPDSVLISGPELSLKNIEFINLVTLSIQDAHENIEETLDVILPKNSSKIKINKLKADIKITVDKFTEGEIIAPVFIKNPPSEKVTIFPKTVKVIFKVQLKNFNKITPNSFKIMCDYQETKNDSLMYLIPKIILKPEEISSVRIIPEKIDFLIYK